MRCLYKDQAAIFMVPMAFKLLGIIYWGNPVKKEMHRFLILEYTQQIQL